MKKIESTPISFEFAEENSKNGTLTIEEDDGLVSFSFDITTPILYRMGNELDNNVQLLLDGKWEVFTTGLGSSQEEVKPELTIIENNNKRSRYILRISLNRALPIEIDARAEGMPLR